MPQPGHDPANSPASTTATPTSGLAGQQDYVQRVNELTLSKLQLKRSEVEEIAPSGTPLVDALIALTSGGKKLRPVLAWLGWRAAGQAATQAPALDTLGASLELFQAAALVHDDVIDRSDTRRGQPSTHRRFEALHGEQSFTGSQEHFGASGAILSGDLALSWASEFFAQAEVLAGHSQARATFERMHTEVITGQYLDVIAEVSPHADSEQEALTRARRVVTYKAAKYSTQHPIVLGCTLAGGTSELQDALAAAALPVGVAFQLRDDLLGVFGDPAVTGKPVGDDLTEGKRTELVAYGLHRSSPAAARELEAMLGVADLSEPQVARAREILVVSGALALVEDQIRVHTEMSMTAIEALGDYGVAEPVRQDLLRVAEALTTRET